MKILDRKILLQRSLAILIIIAGFEWFDILQFFLQKYLNIVSILAIGAYSLPVTIAVVVLGLTMFDKTFALQLKRPRGATLIGLIFIWSSSIIFDIFKPLSWSEKTLFWDLEFNGAVALIPILIIFLMSLYIGVGFLRLNLWAWRLCIAFLVYNIIDYLVQQYEFVKTGGIEAMNAAFQVDPNINNLGMRLHKETVIFTGVLYLLLFAYLFVIKNSFKRYV